MCIRDRNKIFKTYPVILLLLGRSDYCLSLTVRFRGVLSAYLLLCVSASVPQEHYSLQRCASSPPKMLTRRSCPCKSYKTSSWCKPIHDDCEHWLLASHLETLCFTAESLLCCVFHVWCHTLMMVLAAASFASSGLMAIAFTRRLSAAPTSWLRSIHT